MFQTVVYSTFSQVSRAVLLWTQGTCELFVCVYDVVGVQLRTLLNNSKARELALRDELADLREDQGTTTSDYDGDDNAYDDQYDRADQDNENDQNSNNDQVPCHVVRVCTQQRMHSCTVSLASFAALVSLVQNNL